MYLHLDESSTLDIDLYATSSWKGQIGIQFLTDQNTRPATLVVKVELSLKLPYLVSNPSYLSNQVVRGGQTFVPFRITNMGEVESGVKNELNDSF
jgi:hypothetical protein